MNYRSLGARRSTILARAALSVFAVLLPVLGLLLNGAPAGAASAQAPTPLPTTSVQAPTPPPTPSAQAPIPQLTSLGALAATPQPAASGRYQVYLPLVRRAGQTTPPTPTPPPASASGAFFATTQLRTNSAGALVDGDGGMHMAFVFFLSYGENPPAVYAYCPAKPASDCANPDTWQAVALSTQVDEVQLALTPDGKPRLLIRKLREGYTQDEYVYAECDSGCSNKDQWSLTTVAYAGGTDVFGKDNPQHYFALDPQGRPRFVYTNGWGAGYPEGAYYAYCDESCSDSANWYATSMYEGPQYRSLGFDYPSLKFTRSGQPRVIANIAFSGEAQGVRYLACDEGCGDISGWQSVLLYERGGGVAASWDLELDANGRPRLAFYQADTGDGNGERLFYAWCDSGCLSATSWQRRALTNPGDGRNADLALDAQGRPRIAFNAAGGAGVGYLWCDAACESAGATWKRQLAEPSSKLQQEFPVPYPLDHCEPSVWAEMIPSLALDPQGNPRIAYDALNVSKCYYDDDFDPSTPMKSKIEYLWRAARWVFFDQPA